MRNSRIFFAVLSFSYLAFGSWAIKNVVITAPAFNPSLLVPTVFGDTRVAPSRDMFHPGDYYLQVAHGYLSADIAVPNPATEGEGFASEEQMTEWALVAQDYSKDGLSHSPANAHLWTALAWSSALVGEIQKAQKAMERSRALAPYNLQLAYDRMLFTSLVVNNNGAATAPLTTEEIIGTKRDFRTLQKFDPAAARIASEQPELSILLQSFDRRE